VTLAPFITDEDFTLYAGDVEEVLRELPSASVDCVVTSPPYWALRDYGTGEWEGGSPECTHEPDRSSPSSTLVGTTDHQGQARIQPSPCPRCGALRVDGQIGLEATPEEYVARMVGVFAEVARVLRPRGVLWLNIGDTYAGSGTGGNADETREQGFHGSFKVTPSSLRERAETSPPPRRSGLRPKNLVGIPWRLAFGLQADGWIVRSEVIWSKPNVMPESALDRPTRSHEHVFLLTRSPRYYYDGDAIRDPYAGRPQQRLTSTAEQPLGAARSAAGVQNGPQGGEHVPAYDGGVGALTLDESKPSVVGPDGRRKTTVRGMSGSAQHRDGERWPNPDGRNARTVWELVTEPYSGAHFATFPTALVARCILAGCPEGGVVLDPFIGSGTTALVARKLGRSCVGIDLSPVFCELAAKRTQQLSLFAASSA